MPRDSDPSSDPREPLPRQAPVASEDERRPGPLEGIFQETVRRAAGLGFSSFFLTEEALRRAFSEAAPRDWVQYFSSQSDEIRKQLIDRALTEFGDWLKKIDANELLKTLLAEHDFNVNIQVSASPKSGASDAAGSSLKIVTKRRS